MLEAVITAFKRTNEYNDIEGREFSFSHKGVQHSCYFGKSTDRLTELGKATVLYGSTSTDYRNMESFKLYAMPESDKDRDRVSTPLSLQISNVEWSEEKVVNLVHHLNFYLKYFDFLSPMISVHEKAYEGSSARRSRYVDGQFPKHIVGRELNQILVSFWSAAHSEDDPARRFLYYYRIIEYVSFFHLDNSIRSAVKKALSSPNVGGNINLITDQVVTLVRESKADEYARFRATMLELVEERHIIREIQNNLAYFRQSVKFDGGFESRPLLPDLKAEHWGHNGMENFVGSLRDIRNALSHGRDQKTGQVILPTRANLRRLQPWVHLISSSAAEVILYEGTV